MEKMLEEEINIKSDEITKLTEEIDEKDTIISQLKAVNSSAKVSSRSTSILHVF